MFKPNKIISYLKIRELGNYISFDDLLSAKERLYADILKEFGGELPLTLSKPNITIVAEESYDSPYIDLEISFSYKNPNFKSEMKAYKEWEIDQLNIKKLQDKVIKEYEAKKLKKND
jgi:hypothetical protein